MKHTECEDCKLRNGDCGHHFKMNGKTNYDIPSLTACDRYGNCEFFQKKEKLKGDLISREALKKKIKSYADDQYAENEYLGEYAIMDIIDNAPTVIPDNDIFEWCTDCKEYDQEKHCCHRWSSKIRETIEEIKQYKLDELRPQGEWINHRNDYGHNIADCSLCGKAMQWHDEDEDGIPRYCWYCGASMRGDKE